jgi:protein TonB
MAEPLLSLRQLEVGRDFAQRRTLRNALGAAVVLHVLVAGVIIWRPHVAPVRVGVAPSGPMTAYISTEPAGTSGVSPPVSKPRPPKNVMPAKVADPQPASNETGGEQQTGTAGLTQGSGGPVRIGTGQLQLLTRVEPIYPPLMLQARQTGTVVLDAVIRADGTIDEVKILQSRGALFDQSAINAVKQWRYSPPGFEAVLTVTVIFSIK